MTQNPFLQKGPEARQCFSCKEWFDDKKQLSQHFTSHQDHVVPPQFHLQQRVAPSAAFGAPGWKTTKPDGPKQCTVCRAHFGNKAELKRHFQEQADHFISKAVYSVMSMKGPPGTLKGPPKADVPAVSPVPQPSPPPLLSIPVYPDHLPLPGPVFPPPMYLQPGMLIPPYVLPGPYYDPMMYRAPLPMRPVPVVSPKPDMPRECSICKEMFANRSALGEHFRLHPDHYLPKANYTATFTYVPPAPAVAADFVGGANGPEASQRQEGTPPPGLPSVAAAPDALLPDPSGRGQTTTEEASTSPFDTAVVVASLPPMSPESSSGASSGPAPAAAPVTADDGAGGATGEVQETVSHIDELHGHVPELAGRKHLADLVRHANGRQLNAEALVAVSGAGRKFGEAFVKHLVQQVGRVPESMFAPNLKILAGYDTRSDLLAPLRTLKDKSNAFMHDGTSRTSLSDVSELVSSVLAVLRRLDDYQKVFGPVDGPAGPTNPLPTKYRTTQCRFFALSGTCPHGTNCHFLHGAPGASGVPSHPADGRRRRAAAAAAAAAANGAPQQPAAVQPSSSPQPTGGPYRRTPLPPGVAPYRIVPCRHWETTGTCAFGDRCTFIHRPEMAKEARQVHRAPVSRPVGFVGAPIGSGSGSGSVDAAVSVETKAAGDAASARESASVTDSVAATLMSGPMLIDLGSSS